MALTLNDEQERALREWFHLSHTSPSQWHPHDPGAGLRLAQAIAPLMKPWRVEYGTLTDKWFITADGRSQSLHASSKELAHRICDLLNESEARNGPCPGER